MERYTAGLGNLVVHEYMTITSTLSNKHEHHTWYLVVRAHNLALKPLLLPRLHGDFNTTNLCMLE
jgi:hypothetical protein